MKFKTKNIKIHDFFKKFLSSPLSFPSVPENFTIGKGLFCPLFDKLLLQFQKKCDII